MQQQQRGMERGKGAMHTTHTHMHMHIHTHAMFACFSQDPPLLLVVFLIHRTPTVLRVVCRVVVGGGSRQGWQWRTELARSAYPS